MVSGLKLQVSTVYRGLTLHEATTEKTATPIPSLQHAHTEHILALAVLVKTYRQLQGKIITVMDPLAGFVLCLVLIRACNTAQNAGVLPIFSSFLMEKIISCIIHFCRPQGFVFVLLLFSKNCISLVWPLEIKGFPPIPPESKENCMEEKMEESRWG